MVGFPNLTFDKRFLLVEKNCLFFNTFVSWCDVLSLVYTVLCSSYQDLNIVFQNLKLV